MDRSNFNPAKSRCFFSSNIHGSLKAAIKCSMNMKELNIDYKYLGNYLFPSSRKKEKFDYIKKKFVIVLRDGGLNCFHKAGGTLLLNM